ncbi:MAG: helix-turn-helix transcriptional regulator [Desulfuromusa sp.]|nr:helix-turn-helix transcriptional regulator [Desulfuromusa sp.]
MKKNEFKERLRELIGDEKPFPWAERIGITPGVFNRMWNDGVAPKADSLEKISKVTGVSLDWLILGKSQKEKSEKFSVVEEHKKYNLNSDEFALVPRYNVQASAGGGADVHSEQVVDHLAFKRSWLHEMGLQQEKLALITAKGDSMEPTIKNGDMLLVDTRVTTAADGIYVLRMDGMLLAKRLIKNPIDQSVTVKSDNNIYPPVTAQKDQLGLLEIVGRVVWIGGKI